MNETEPKKDVFDDFETVEVKQKTKKPFVKKPYDPNFKKNQAMFTKNAFNEENKEEVVDSDKKIAEADTTKAATKIPEV